MALLPPSVPVACLHSRRDESVPFALSAGYVGAACAAGAEARLIETNGDHMSLVDPASPDWHATLDALAELTG